MAKTTATTTPQPEPGGWFHNVGARALTLLHELGTFVIEAGDAVKLPFKAEHHDLVEVTEDAGKVIAQHAAEEASAAAKAAEADTAAEVHQAAEDIAAKTESAPATAAAETPKE